MHISLNGFGKQWDVFFKCVVGREKMLAYLGEVVGRFHTGIDPGGVSTWRAEKEI